MKDKGERERHAWATVNKKVRKRLDEGKVIIISRRACKTSYSIVDPFCLQIMSKILGQNRGLIDFDQKSLASVCHPSCQSSPCP